LRERTNAVAFRALGEKRLDRRAVGALTRSFCTGETGLGARSERLERGPRVIESLLSPQRMAVCQRLHPVCEREVGIGVLCGLERLRRVFVLEAVEQRDPAQEVGLRRGSSRIREDDAPESRMLRRAGVDVILRTSEGWRGERECREDESARFHGRSRNIEERGLRTNCGLRINCDSVQILALERSGRQHCLPNFRLGGVSFA
jgi:hypothetical protein